MSEDISLDDFEELQGVKEDDHYSWSRLNMYMRCPFQYMFRYLCGYKMPPASVLVFGSTSHEALEIQYKQKIESRKDLPAKKMQEIWAFRWEKNLKTNVGMEYDEGENKSVLLDDGIRLIAAYQQVVAPKIQPLVVEEPFSVDIPNVDKPIIGRIDLIDEVDTIIDHKNVKREKSQFEVDKDGQLTMYDIAHIGKYQKHAAGLEMDYLVKTKMPKFVRIKTIRDDEAIESFKQTIATVTTCITQGLFYPNPSGTLCSEKFCGYWKYCKGGRAHFKKPC